jgi:hypothetical protein
MFTHPRAHTQVEEEEHEMKHDDDEEEEAEEEEEELVSALGGGWTAVWKRAGVVSVSIEIGVHEEMRRRWGLQSALAEAAGAKMTPEATREAEVEVKTLFGAHLRRARAMVDVRVAEKRKQELAAELKHVQKAAEAELVQEAELEPPPSKLS